MYSNLKWILISVQRAGEPPESTIRTTQIRVLNAFSTESPESDV